MLGKAPAIHGVRSRGPRSNSTAGGSMSANRAVTRPIRRALDLVDDDEPPAGVRGRTEVAPAARGRGDSPNRKSDLRRSPPRGSTCPPGVIRGWPSPGIPGDRWPIWLGPGSGRGSFFVLKYHRLKMTFSVILEARLRETDSGRYFAAAAENRAVSNRGQTTVAARSPLA